METLVIISRTTGAATPARAAAPTGAARAAAPARASTPAGSTAPTGATGTSAAPSTATLTAAFARHVAGNRVTLALQLLPDGEPEQANGQGRDSALGNLSPREPGGLRLIGCDGVVIVHRELQSFHAMALPITSVHGGQLPWE